MSKSSWCGFLLAALVCAASDADAATLTLPATQDSWIRQDSPTANGGSDLYLGVRNQTGATRRTLIQFNMSAIRSCALVSSATLRLRIGANTQPAGGASRVHSIHRLTATWSELQVTWARRITTTTWTSAGGDFAAATATATAPAGTGAYVDFDVTADVAAFVRGTETNFGWLVKDVAESGLPSTTVGYASRTTLAAADRPVLSVTYAGDDSACADPNPCTQDTCDLAQGCVHTNLLGTPCTTDDNPCTTDACDGAGTCAHPPGNAGAPCAEDGNPCTLDACDAGACAHPPGNAGTACRSTAGECDVAEQCDGANPDCPADVRSTSVCRSAAGECDLAESCDGVSDLCPPDLKAVDVCRSAAGVCDVPESCDGASDDCPLDAVVSVGVDCRSAAGACDAPEACNGVDGACPADGFTPAGTTCRTSLGVCDPAEECSGSAADCPPDARSTAICRSATGGCDVPEGCDGVGADCPADTIVEEGAECRPAAGPCDVAETCSGTGTCPPDSVLPSTVTCRSSIGTCDVSEQCDGATAGCAIDVVRDADTVCRSAAGECDAEDTCDGTSGACPADAKRADVCRSAAGACDPSESCDGIGDACPGDAIAPAGAVCRSATSDCDTPELCTGDALECPADVFVECGRRASVECHNLHGGRFTQRTVTVTDPYSGTSQLRLLLEGHVCNAVSINGSAIDDPTVHYHSFIATQNPPHIPFPDYRVTNVFGPLVLEIKHATLLMLPAGVAVGADAPPPTPGVDAYLCYRLEFPAFRNFYVFHEDQFTTPPVNIRIRKPRLLCAAASVDGSPVSNPGAFMICYRHVRKLPAPNDVDVKKVHVRSQLGTVVGVAGKDDLLCLQSTALSPPP